MTHPADTEAGETAGSSESDAGVQRLVDEQAALRRVATLVAEGATRGELFSAVAEEVARILDVTSVSVVQYESDRSSIVVASIDDPGFPVGSRWPLEEPSLNAKVFATAGPARIDHTELPGSVAAAARAAGVQSGVGVPIIVDGSVWGMVAVGRKHQHEPLPPEIEVRLAAFTELVATAISNAMAHDALHRLAEEQAALRRVATLIAGTASRDEVFAAVAGEVARIFDLPWVGIMRYEPSDSFTVIATWGEHPFPVGSRWPLDGPSTFESVLRTGRPARIADYAGLPGTVAEGARRAGIVGGIGAPIVVDGSTWGVIAAPSTRAQPIPDGAETRLSQFTELLATAVSNLQARDDLEALAQEQAALRRVATLVAEGTTTEELFAGVASEVAKVLDVSASLLDRYEPDGTALTLATSLDPDWEEAKTVFHVGMRFPPSPGSLTAIVHDTGRAARIDDYSVLGGAIGELARTAVIGSGCATPITVDGQLWGTIGVFSRPGALLPAGMEARLQGFTELVATAISNGAARAELIASRARIVAAGDEARRRIERNLHDGTQQRLIAVGLDLQRIRATLPGDRADVHSGLDRMENDLVSLLEEVRELSRGLHPPLLSRGGLRPSLRALARRSPIPVQLDIELPERPAAAIETAVYYVASEALANAIKHSQASAIFVTVETDYAGVPFAIGIDGRRGNLNLHATIVDDGVGGAEPADGSGLMGLVDRIDALGGRFTLDSPPGLGTRISIVLPVGTI